MDGCPLEFFSDRKLQICTNIIQKQKIQHYKVVIFQLNEMTSDKLMKLIFPSNVFQPKKILLSDFTMLYWIIIFHWINKYQYTIKHLWLFIKKG